MKKLSIITLFLMAFVLFKMRPNVWTFEKPPRINQAESNIINKCLEKRIIVNEKYHKRIDGINVAQEDNSEPYYIVSTQAMKEIHERYNVLVEYTNCLEKNAK